MTALYISLHSNVGINDSKTTGTARWQIIREIGIGTLNTGELVQ